MILSPVLNILGLLTTILGAAMLIPMCVDLYFGSSDWQVFALSALLTAFVGVSVWLATAQREGFDLGLRQAFLLTNGSWISIGIFGALPFMFCELQLSLTDAMFEIGVRDHHHRIDRSADHRDGLARNPDLAGLAAMAWWCWNHRHGDGRAADAVGWRHAAVPHRIL